MSKAVLKARQILEDCGIDDATEMPLDLIVAGRGATLIETPLKNADGRIVHGKSRSIIKVNSNIAYDGRKRFAIAHELGHYFIDEHSIALAQNLSAGHCSQTGFVSEIAVEREADLFAASLLMPERRVQEKYSTNN